MKEFVRESCSKRIKLMVNGVEPINPDLHAQWTHITGHTIKLYWKKLDVVYRIGFSTLLWKTRRTTSFEQIFFPSSSLQFKKRTFFWWWRQQLLRTASVCERMTASRFFEHTQTHLQNENIFCIMAVTNNIDNSVLFCQRKISGFRSFEKIKKSFKYVFLVFIIVDR